MSKIQGKSSNFFLFNLFSKSFYPTLSLKIDRSAIFLPSWGASRLAVCSALPIADLNSESWMQGGKGAGKGRDFDHLWLPDGEDFDVERLPWIVVMWSFDSLTVGYFYSRKDIGTSYVVSAFANSSLEDEIWNILKYLEISSFNASTNSFQRDCFLLYYSNCTFPDV